MDKRLLIFGNLFRVSNRLQTVMDSLMEGLTAKQWFVILIMGLFEEPPTLKELAAACDSSHQNIRQIVLKLQDKGFMHVEKDARDARAMRISLTPKCAEWDEANSERAARFLGAMFCAVSPEEITATSRALMKIYGKLGEEFLLDGTFGKDAQA